MIISTFAILGNQTRDRDRKVGELESTLNVVREGRKHIIVFTSNDFLDHALQERRTLKAAVDVLVHNIRCSDREIKELETALGKVCSPSSSSLYFMRSTYVIILQIVAFVSANGAKYEAARRDYQESGEYLLLCRLGEEVQAVAAKGD